VKRCTFGGFYKHFSFCGIADTPTPTLNRDHLLILPNVDEICHKTKDAEDEIAVEVYSETIGPCHCCSELIFQRDRE